MENSMRMTFLKKLHIARHVYKETPAPKELVVRNYDECVEICVFDRHHSSHLVKTRMFADISGGSASDLLIEISRNPVPIGRKQHLH